MTKVKISCIQMKMNESFSENLSTATKYLKQSAANGANVVLLPELFLHKYFCQSENLNNFKIAIEKDSKILEKFSNIANDLNLVLPISFFEKSGNKYFNSVVVFDSDGKDLGTYRKSHLPTGQGYQEKYYFHHGDTGFKVFKTNFGKIGVGICWDQWFPETARSLALQGCDLIVFPTAIGNEPQYPEINSLQHWKNAIKGHSASNMVPIAVANRFGKEDLLQFYGNSFICNQYGGIVDESKNNEEGIISAEFDFKGISLLRASWGVLRDRRPELYGDLVNEPFEQIERNHFPLSKTVRVPAEWEYHEKTFICWPYDRSNWKNGCKEGRRAFSEVVDALTTVGEERVVVLVVKNDFEDVKKLFESNNFVTVRIVPYNDSWARDICPTFTENLKNGKRLAVLHEFNGYGLKFPHNLDSMFKKKLCSELEIDVEKCPLILEGGAIESNGDGICIAVKPTILGRNKQFTKSKIERILFLYFGFEDVIWFNRGLHNDIDTDGHVDNICRFVSKNAVALYWSENKNDENYKICRDAYRKLKKAEIKIKLEIIKINAPSCKRVFTSEEITGLENPIESLRKIGQTVCQSYLNFYIANSAVLVPGFGIDSDSMAIKQLEECFPGRKVVRIDARSISLGGGGIHCILHEKPM